jgi:hypothetical protein
VLARIGGSAGARLPTFAVDIARAVTASALALLTRAVVALERIAAAVEQTPAGPSLQAVERPDPSVVINNVINACAAAASGVVAPLVDLGGLASVVRIEAGGTTWDLDRIDLSSKPGSVYGGADYTKHGLHPAGQLEIEVVLKWIAASAPDGLTSELIIRTWARYLLQKQFGAATTLAVIIDVYNTERYSCLRRSSGNPRFRH